MSLIHNNQLEVVEGSVGNCMDKVLGIILYIEPEIVRIYK